MPETNFPIAFEDKVNSPELLAFLSQYGEENYVRAELINLFRDALNELDQRTPGGSGAGPILRIAAYHEYSDSNTFAVPVGYTAVGAFVENAYVLFTQVGNSVTLEGDLFVGNRVIIETIKLP